MDSRPKKLLEQVNDAIRLMHYSPCTGLRELRQLDQALHPIIEDGRWRAF